MAKTIEQLSKEIAFYLQALEKKKQELEEINKKLILHPNSEKLIKNKQTLKEYVKCINNEYKLAVQEKEELVTQQQIAEQEEEKEAIIDKKEYKEQVSTAKIKPKNLTRKQKKLKKEFITELKEMEKNVQKINNMKEIDNFFAGLGIVFGGTMGLLCSVDIDTDYFGRLAASVTLGIFGGLAGWIMDNTIGVSVPAPIQRYEITELDQLAEDPVIKNLEAELEIVDEKTEESDEKEVIFAY